MGEYEKVGDLMDKDEVITGLVMKNIENIVLPPVDHFYRGIS